MLDSRFGVDSVQSVSLLSGQGRCPAASEETDPLTVEECCGGQAARSVSTIPLQQDAALIHDRLLLPTSNDFNSRLVRGNKLLFLFDFQTQFSWGEFLVCFRDVLQNVERRTPLNVCLIVFNMRRSLMED